MYSLERRVPPLALTVVWGGGMYGVASLLPDLDLAIAGHLWIAGLILFTSCWVMVAAVRRFQLTHTTVNPTRPGKASALVTTGVYRISRNPMYLGFLLALMALALVLSNVAAFVLMAMIVPYLNRFQIQAEERALREMFGETYRAYCRQVRRWI